MVAYLSAYLSLRICGWCDRTAPYGTDWPTRSTEFGPVPICDRCGNGETRQQPTMQQEAS